MKSMAKCLVVLMGFVLLQNFTFAVSFAITLESPLCSQSTLYHSNACTQQIKVTNQNSWYTETCQYQVSNDQAWTLLGNIPASQSSSFSVIVTAPATGSGTATSTVYVYCNDATNNPQTKQTSFSVNYGPSPQETQEQQQALQAQQQTQTQQTQANLDRTNAQNAITAAQTQIDVATTKINSVNNLGADTTIATQNLNNAKTDKSTADTYLQNANTAYTQGQYTTASTNAQSAITSANSAKTKATDAYNSAVAAETQASKAKTDAKAALDTATALINDAKEQTDSTKKLVDNATTYGLDLSTAQASLIDATKEYTNSQTYKSLAQNAYDAGNYENSKINAQNAQNSATIAKTKANEAYSTANTLFNKFLQTEYARARAQKIANETKKNVGDLKETVHKVDLLLNFLERKKIDVNEAKAWLKVASEKVESAEDNAGKVDTYVKSKEYDSALKYATSASDDLVVAQNKLDNIVDNMKKETLNALRDSADETTLKMEAGKQRIQNTTTTFAVDVNDITKAQNEIISTKTRLENAYSSIENAESSRDVSDFFIEATAALSQIDAAEKSISLAITKADSAEKSARNKVLASGASIVGVGGVGFLLYKRKSKKTNNSDAKPHHEKEKKVGEIEHKEKHCMHCGEKVAGHSKYCHSCGKKL